MNNIRILRQKRSMQQKELAIALGVTQGAISQWEKGLAEPSGKSLVKLSQFFGVPVDQILGKESQQTIKEKPTTTNGSWLDAQIMDLMSQLSIAEKIQICESASKLISNRKSSVSIDYPTDSIEK